MKYTKDQLIHRLQEKAKELGRTPSMREMSNPGRGTYINFFGSWNKTLEASKLPPLRQSKLRSKKEYIELLRLTSEKLGRTPSQKEMKESESIVKVFGGWNKALVAAKLKIRQKHKYQQNDYYEALDWWIRTNKKVPLRSEWDNDPYVPSIKSIKGNLGLTWNQFLIKSGYNPLRKSPEAVCYTLEELLTMYIDKSKKLGYPAKIRDLDDDLKMCSSRVFVSRFGSMYQLRKEAKLPTGANKLQFTKGQVEKELIRLYQHLGRRLTVKEIDNICSFSSTTARMNFRSTSLTKIWEEIESKLTEK